MKDHNPWELNEVNSNKTDLLSDNFKRSALDIQPQRIIGAWPYMILSAGLALFIAWTYLRYELNVYEVRTSAVLESNQGMGALESIYSTKDPLNNQIALLRSPTVAKRVVDKLHLNYHSWVDGKFRDRDLYNQLEWWVTDSVSNRTNFLRFEIIPKGDQFEWRIGASRGIAFWGRAFDLEGTWVQVNKKSLTLPGSVIQMMERDPWNEANLLSGSMSVGSQKDNNVVNIAFQDIVPQRGVAILRELIPAYREEAKINKSISLQQSLNFIQDRLIPVTMELDSVETVISNYKMEIGFQGQTMEEGSGFKMLQQYELQLEDLALIEARLNFAQKQFATSNIEEDLNLSGITDPVLQSRVEKFNKLQEEQRKLSRTLSTNNPRMAEVDNMLSEARQRMGEEFDIQRRNLDTMRSKLSTKLGELKLALRELPELEREMDRQTRMRGIKQTLFTMLLQNREEVAIKLASVSVETAVLSPPKIPSVPVSPKRQEIMIGAFLAGLLFPLIIVMLKELLNNKIISRKQLQQLSSTPVLAEIDQAKDGSESIVVSGRDRSIIGEQFRSLRTNLGFYGKPGKTLFVVLTSSMSGEGKSFISANLAASFAILGKKVALLEFDLRKPKLRQRFDLPASRGIVNVLMGEDEPGTIAVPIMEGYHYDLFPSGPIPPNPSELMAMSGMEKLKRHLDYNYDVVIIDTPPFGLVTDAQLLNDWADVSLVVVRFMATVREQVIEIEESKRRKTFSKMALIFNGIKTSGYYGYRYGYYGQKRKYGYGYYTKTSG
jgi:capsular exopolysaccharide synthesis family protein